MSATTKTHKIVFTADHSWWEMRQDDFETADDFDDEAMAFVQQQFGDEVFFGGCEEAFAVTIRKVDPEHTAIRVGDVIVSDGIGSDKYFVRPL